jgi:hypothetical protein
VHRVAVGEFVFLAFEPQLADVARAGFSPPLTHGTPPPTA